MLTRAASETPLDPFFAHAMKILLVINSLEGGGAERVACTLAQHWSTQGHQVSIVTLHGGPIVYDLPPEVQLYSLEARRLLRGPGRLALVPVGALELARLLEKLKPDATISFLTRSNLIHVLTRWFGNQKPIYISERSFSEAEYVGPRRVVGMMVRRLYPLATRIVAISEGVKNSLGRMGVPTANITTIYNPQNLDEIRAEAQSIPAEKRPTQRSFRMVMAGRLAEPKDYGTLLEALAVLRQRKLDIRLVVLGDGPHKAALHDKARALGVDDCVEWKGWVTNIHAVMATCDVFTFASTYEGFGNVLVEAMACGLPVVSTDCPGGPREILEGGKHGFLVPMFDHVRVAEAVQALVTDPSVYADYKARALARAEAFDVGRVADQYLRLLRGGLGALAEEKATAPANPPPA